VPRRVAVCSTRHLQGGATKNRIHPHCGSRIGETAAAGGLRASRGMNAAVRARSHGHCRLAYPPDGPTVHDGLKVLEVFEQLPLAEVGQKVRPRRLVDPHDRVDELSLGHGSQSVARGPRMVNTRRLLRPPGMVLSAAELRRLEGLAPHETFSAGLQEIEPPTIFAHGINRSLGPIIGELSWPFTTR
jgi:hypothetical protein